MPEASADDKGPAQVTFLQNFVDELPRRVRRATDVQLRMPSIAVAVAARRPSDQSPFMPLSTGPRLVPDDIVAYLSN